MLETSWGAWRLSNWTFQLHIEFLPEYLKQDEDKKYSCDADIIARNRSDLDPKSVCGDNYFLPFIDSMKHILHLSLLFQSSDLKIYTDLKTYT